MPPPPPDRRDYLYREGRRHDGGGVGDPLPPPAPTPPRWRDSPYHPPPPPMRDHARPSPRRLPSSASSEGYYRQGGGAYDRSYPEDPPLGYTPSRSDRYWLEEDGGGYKAGRYGGGGGRRDGRDMRGSYRRSPFRSYGSDLSRNHQEQPPPPPPRRSPLRSVAVPICYDPPSNRVDRGDRDNLPRVTPWRRRESRSEVTDAGAGPVSVGRSSRTSASEKEVSTQPRAMAAPHEVEEEAPRKKPRLGWGQGLAKYEKQKVQGPVDSAETVADGSPVDAEQKTSSPEHAPALVLCPSPVAGPSPVAAPVICPSPVAAPAACPPVVAPSPVPAICPSPVAAPSPVAVPAICPSPVAAPSPAPPYCSSAPEEKSCELTANMITESTKDAPRSDDQACNNEEPIKLDQLGDEPIKSLANILSELVQYDESCSGDSKGLTSTSKLLLLKESISKEIEKAELEIDSLEGELKSVNTEAGTALEDSPTGVTYAENLSPSSGTSKVRGGAKICGAPHVKEPGELIPRPMMPVEQDTVKSADMMEVETAPVHNAKTVSSEESVVCPGVVQGQTCAAADVVPLQASQGAGPPIDVDSERVGASPCQLNVGPLKDGTDDQLVRQCSCQEQDYNLIGSLTFCNNNMAKVANELVFKPLPSATPYLDLLASSHVPSQRRNEPVIKEKLAIRKNKLRFKEQTLTFKFKVLRHLWKEDVQLLSAKKQRSKSNKRIDQSNRTSQIGSQKQRSSNRSRLSMPAGNLSLLPTPEMSNVASKLFSEFQIKRCRNYLKMPALIIDEKDKECSRFISKNGLVEDPVSVEKERIMINPWTEDEKEIFMEMLAKFGKDFSKISNFLSHKTTADCVEFYYKHHKSDSFREVKKLLDLRQQQQPTSNFLGAKSAKKWNPEANAASLDMLGAASAVAARGLEYANRVEKNSAKSLIRTAYGSNVSFMSRKSSDRECVDNVPLHERESVAADVLAGICGTLSPEGMGSCITSSPDPGQKISITRMEHAVTPKIDKNFDEEDTLSDQECEVDPVDWNDDEKLIFIEAMNNHGKDFARISSCVKSKSYEQCKVFFSKARKSLGLDLIYQGAADVSMPTSDTNGGRSDTDEACAVEMVSATCSVQSGPKVELDVCSAPERAIGETNSGIFSKQLECDRSNECDIAEVKTEKVENKADKNCSLVGHQAACAPIDTNCPESTDKLQGMDGVTDQVNMHSNNVVSSSTEQAVAVHSEVRSSLHPIEVHQTNKVPELFGPDISRMEGCLHHGDDAPMKAGNSGASACLAADSGSKDNFLNFSNMTVASSLSPVFTSSYQHSMPGEMPPSKPKPQVTPLTPKDLMPVQFSAVLPDPTSVRFAGITSITTSNSEDSGSIVSNALGGKNMNKYLAFKDQSVNQHDTLFRNIDGYTTHHMTTESSFFSERCASGTLSTSQPDRFTLTKYQNGRSSSLGLPNTNDGIQWARKHGELLEGSLRTLSRNASSSEGDEQLKRPGDVKLFGQILSHQSSLQSSGSSCNGSKGKPPSLKVDTSCVRSSINTRDRVTCSSRPAVTAHLGLEERPGRSYGHLDGTTTQPEPLLVMAKCQRSLAGVPFYSAKNGTLGVFSDYQQPLVHQSDPKRLERYADPQKKNGMEFISGFQQPGKVPRFGGAGILVSGVSDPVAALKAQYGAGSKIISSDVDPWKDIGSR